MKQIAIFLISIYQWFFRSVIQQILGVRTFCRFSPSCSDYTKSAIDNHGLIKGVVLGAKRILRCNPYKKAV